VPETTPSSSAAPSAKTNLNFHFPPVGKGNTYPESLDIVAVTGPQPGNFATVSSHLQMF